MASSGEGDAEHTMLLGEADMSYAKVLGLQGFNGVITATELDDPSHLVDRYFGSHSRLAERCNELTCLGIRVLLGVDGIRLERNDVCHHWCASSEFIKAPLWSAYVPPVSRFVFNFPHTTRPGKMCKLLNQIFRSVRASIARGFARPDCRVEMRLLNAAPQLIRSRYGHEDAAAASCFELISVAPADLDQLCSLGYEHVATKRHALAGVRVAASMWTWRAGVLSSPRLQLLPRGCRRDVLFTPEALIARETREHASWKGGIQVPYYLVRWQGFPGSDGCTWERAGDLDLELRRAFDVTLATQPPPQAAARDKGDHLHHPPPLPSSSLPLAAATMLAALDLASDASSLLQAAEAALLAAQMRAADSPAAPRTRDINAAEWLRRAQRPAMVEAWLRCLPSSELCASLAQEALLLVTQPGGGWTHWISPSEDTPRCGLEALALRVLALHLGRLSDPAAHLSEALVGAEWWVQARDGGGEDMPVHWDCDEVVKETEGVHIPPYLATVTYLSPLGAPTLVLPVSTDAWGHAKLAPPESAQGAYASFPVVGKHMSFDGRLLHGVITDGSSWTPDPSNDLSGPLPPPLMGSAATGNARRAAPQRVTVLVNVWIGHRPSGAKRLSDETASILGAITPDACSPLALVANAFASAVPAPSRPSTADGPAQVDTDMLRELQPIGHGIDHPPINLHGLNDGNLAFPRRMDDHLVHMPWVKVCCGE